ncbi:hypothetical protein [Mesorhizobium erdmanii]|uniref:hypothetical protein n=1 Tax=Mesorhizobium erdmanii TaxID=1777866 RepID=UPI0013E928F6|nr:hypothetical protein [Mesorhizobium erdmanii]
MPSLTQENAKKFGLARILEAAKMKPTLTICANPSSEPSECAGWSRGAIRSCGIDPDQE